jgi:hypothetical protein
VVGDSAAEGSAVVGDSAAADSAVVGDSAAADSAVVGDSAAVGSAVVGDSAAVKVRCNHLWCKRPNRSYKSCFPYLSGTYNNRILIYS